MKPRRLVPSEVLDFRKKVGKNLRMIRKSLNLTQDEFSINYNIPRVQVSRLEHGKSRYLDFVFIFELSHNIEVLTKLFNQDISANLYSFIHNKNEEKSKNG